MFFPIGNKIVDRVKATLDIECPQLKSYLDSSKIDCDYINTTKYNNEGC